MLINRAGLVLVGKRDVKAGPEHVDALYQWQMPQGGIDAGEDPLLAAKRELYEETSVFSVSLLMEAPEWYAYDLPDEIIRSAWKGRYRGQTQKWFAFRFEGEDSEINVLVPPGGHKAEFTEWRWEAMQELPGLVIPFKRTVYERVVQAFGHLAAYAP
jgi:putative (di)nucleoside polyphosphate hydrolase